MNAERVELGVREGGGKSELRSRDGVEAATDIIERCGDPKRDSRYCTGGRWLRFLVLLAVAMECRSRSGVREVLLSAVSVKESCSLDALVTDR